MQKQSELRRAVERVQSGGRGKRFPKPLRSKLIAYIRVRRQAGATLKTIASEIGIGFKTISRWLLEEHKGPAFRRVQVVEQQPKRRLTVHGPCGLRVEGMALEQLAELLRRLA